MMKPHVFTINWLWRVSQKVILQQ